jgi:multisubunit Na+/H+ antiporter MnhF subunit
MADTSTRLHVTDGPATKTTTALSVAATSRPRARMLEQQMVILVMGLVLDTMAVAKYWAGAKNSLL